MARLGCGAEMILYRNANVACYDSRHSRDPRPPNGAHMNDFDSIDFFRSDEMIVDPYPYFEALRGECPVRREPHHDVVMVTGYEEALAVFNDTDTFSSCT